MLFLKVIPMIVRPFWLLGCLFDMYLGYKYLTGNIGPLTVCLCQIGATRALKQGNCKIQ